MGSACPSTTNAIHANHKQSHEQHIDLASLENKGFTQSLASGSAPAQRENNRSYRLGIVHALVHDMQQTLYRAHRGDGDDEDFYHINSLMADTILAYLPCYFRVYGIGKHLSNNEITEMDRLRLLEPKLHDIAQLFRGRDKLLLQSYTGELYGIGDDAFDGLFANDANSADMNRSGVLQLKHIHAYRKYFNLVDVHQRIEFVSTSLHSNDVMLKLANGSIYASKLVMDDTTGVWRRIFRQPVFHDLHDLALEKELKIVQVECGLLHCLFRCSNGTVYSVGGNSCGQCGLGYVSERESRIKIVPSLIEPKVNVVAISCGKHHSIAVDDGGTLYAWGLNDEHQCSTTRFQPAVICEPYANFISDGRVVKAECGETFTVYLAEHGIYGGFGKIVVSSLQSMNITKWHNTKERRYRDFSCGANHVILIGKDDRLYCHGSNEYCKGAVRAGRTEKPTPIIHDRLPKDAPPSKVIAGRNCTLVIYSNFMYY